MSKYEIEYDSNNSGGSWWLTDQDWYELEKAGWKVDWYAGRKSPFGDAYGDGRFLGGLASGAKLVVEADSVYEAEEKAIQNFESVTRQCADDGGCPCCGPPHYFSTYKLNQEVANAE